MTARYAASYIDEVLTRKDGMVLHTIISVVSRRHTLPPQCRLFMLAYEWIGSDWQYYESLTEARYQEFAGLLSEFDLLDILSKLDEALSAWRAGDHSIAEVDEWANQRTAQITASLIDRVLPISNILKEKGA